jgi:fumarylacetoacetase
VIDATHDAALRSWVPSANDPKTDFPIQNLPFGRFRRRGSEHATTGVAIGNRILNLEAALSRQLFDAASRAPAEMCAASLADFMSAGSDAWRALRIALSDMLRENSDSGRRASAQEAALLVAPQDAEMLLPCRIGDYTDFYASIAHATNVGSMFRPDNPLLPNYKWVPIGYHGRASSIVVSGTPVRRPSGQIKPDAADQPRVAPTQRLDYELEVGLVVGPGNALGDSIPIARAGAHLFGVVLLNDWSARDIQAWEYQPLGPFLAKNFASSISPWVVTTAALAPFRAQARPRDAGDPPPLPYLADPEDQRAGAFDITLEVYLQSRAMREQGQAAMRLSRSGFSGMYWTPAQLIAHHASNGCNLQPGDLLGSGTVSGESRDARGCLLELTWRGSDPLTLPSGETRRFLEDGDVVTLHGYCERPGYRRIGLGSCTGEVLPASG